MARAKPGAEILSEIPTPALLLDKGRMRSNLSRMAHRARALGVTLRPHIKTHKCIEIGRMQQELGAAGITVSTLYEAEVFANHGFGDITWAFPLIPSRIAQALRLAQRVDLGLVVDSTEALSWLEGAGQPVKVWLKVDCGQERAGVDPRSESAVELAARIHRSTVADFAGILTHSGQAYRRAGQSRLRHVAEVERCVMTELAERLRTNGIPVPQVSVGSTPAMSAADRLTGVTEARPGNYALYDYTQAVLGACEVSDCALTVLSTVVSSPVGSGRSVIDAGALALSRDPGHPEAPVSSFGLILDDSGKPTGDLRVTGVSQEHGIVNRELPVGARVEILPNHSCLTTACFDEVYVQEDGRVEDRWKIWSGR